MATNNLPKELLLPIPENTKEQDLYKTLQDYAKEIDNSFANLEDIEAITAGDGLTDTTNTFAVNVDDSTIEISTDKLQVKGLGIDTAQLAADAVEGSKIADDQIDSEHYVAGSIDNEHLAVESVDSDNYVDGSIDTAHIGDNQVTSAKLEDDLVFGTFPLTPSAYPDADYEVANKKYVDESGGALSNVIFCWMGADSGTDNVFGLYRGTSLSPTMSGETANYLFWGVYNTTYRTIMTAQYEHIAGFSSVKVHGKLWANSAGATDECYLKTTIGSATAQEVKSVTSTTPTWYETATDIDVSGLTVGTKYTITFELKCEAANHAFCSGIILTVT